MPSTTCLRPSTIMSFYTASPPPGLVARYYPAARAIPAGRTRVAVRGPLSFARHQPEQAVILPGWAAATKHQAALRNQVLNNIWIVLARVELIPDYSIWRCLGSAFLRPSNTRLQPIRLRHSSPFTTML